MVKKFYMESNTLHRCLRFFILFHRFYSLPIFATLKKTYINVVPMRVALSLIYGFLTCCAYCQVLDGDTAFYIDIFSSLFFVFFQSESAEIA